MDFMAFGVAIFLAMVLAAGAWMLAAGWDFVRTYRIRVLHEDPRHVMRSRWWLVSFDSPLARWRDPRIVWTPAVDVEVERARRRFLRRYFVTLVVAVLAMGVPFAVRALSGAK